MAILIFVPTIAASMLKNKWIQASLSGILLGLSWPYTGSITPLIFIALIPLLIVEQELFKEKKRSLWSFYPYVFITLLIFNIITTWWIYNVDEPIGVKIFSAVSAIVLNAAFLAIFVSLFHFARSYIGSKEGYISLFLYWIGWEYIHHNWELSWPWISLGNVFSIRPSWVQWYDITGIFGGSFLILLVNLILFFVLQSHINENGVRKKKNLIFLGFVFIFMLGLNFIRSNPKIENKEEVEILLVQPNVDPYTEKFNYASSDVRLMDMLEMVEEKLSPSTDLILFPETSLQEQSRLFYRDDSLITIGLWENSIEQSNSLRILRTFLDDHPDLSLLIGLSSDRVLDKDEEPSIASRYIESYDVYYESYNAAMLLSKDEAATFYYKSELVPAVEFMPFQGVLQYLGEAAIDMGGTTGTLATQEDQIPFVTPKGIAISPAICYESIYGKVSNEFVDNGAEILGIITNDAWWGDSPGYKQHMSFASLRAIETRKYVARSANTGISCFIDPNGKVLEQSEWWQEDVLKGRVFTNEHRTFYSVYGDYIGRSAAFLMIMVLLYSIVLKVKFKNE